MTGWELAGILSDLVTYLAIITLGGTAVVWALAQRHALAAVVVWQRHWAGLLVVAALLGLLSASLGFLLEIGGINQRGLSGMFDQQLAGIMADTALGEGTRLRVIGFALALLSAAALLLAVLCEQPRLRRIGLGMMVLAVAVLARSFAVYGHVAGLGPLSHVAVSLHIVAVAVWLGSLYPLWRLAGSMSPGELQPLLRAFGQAGWYFIAALLLSGLWLLWQLLGGVSALLTTGYGLSLLAKLLLVAALMALGAWNKFRLVPALVSANGPQRLRRSIALEMLLASAILLLTASFTNLIGPP